MITVWSRRDLELHWVSYLPAQISSSYVSLISLGDGRAQADISESQFNSAIPNNRKEIKQVNIYQACSGCSPDRFCELCLNSSRNTYGSFPAIVTEQWLLTTQETCAILTESSPVSHPLADPNWNAAALWYCPWRDTKCSARCQCNLFWAASVGKYLQTSFSPKHNGGHPALSNSELN